MTIKDYYANYELNSKPVFCLNTNPKISHTINDFYNDCIRNCLIDKANVLAWHKMLMEYVDLPDAIYWIRYHESSGKGRTSKRHNNRRACFTRFADNFSYVFVSNFEAHEVFNMVAKGVIPSSQEFLQLMKSFEFPMHYDDKSGSCEEKDMAAYEHVGYHAAGTMTKGNWYLAHINAVKSEYIMPDGISRKLTKSESERLFPRGVIADWTDDKKLRKKIRTLPYILTKEEKEIVKAHFLRFIDPLNYFLTPATSKETDLVTTAGKNIGEYDNLTAFMQDKYISIYGADIQSFTKKALVPKSRIFENGLSIIDVKYGTMINNSKNKSNLCKSKLPKTANVAGTPIGALKIGIYAKSQIEEWLVNNKLSSAQISRLMDKDYCSREFKISFPILVKKDTAFDRKRYYKNIINDEYYICSQWIEKHRSHIENWIKKNNL